MTAGELSFPVPSSSITRHLLPGRRGSGYVQTMITAHAGRQVTWVAAGRLAPGPAGRVALELGAYDLELPPGAGLALGRARPSGAGRGRRDGPMLQASQATSTTSTGHEGCNEILNVTRPDIVRAMHDGYLEAGRGLHHHQHLRREPRQSRRIRHRGPDRGAVRGGRPARPAGGRRSGRARTGPRWVLGSMGPGTKLPTLGHVTFAELRDTYQANAAGLLRGGADALIVETCQDLLQAKAAIIGARRAIGRRPARAILLIAQVTIETTGADAARLRDRRRAHRARAARHRRDRAELRDRARRDERAPAVPRRARPRAAVLHAERRAARS